MKTSSRSTKKFRPSRRKVIFPSSHHKGSFQKNRKHPRRKPASLKLFASYKQRLAAWENTEKELRCAAGNSESLFSLSNDSQDGSPPRSLLSTLDPWQKKAYDKLVSGKNVVVDAPTSAGKTRVVEAYLRKKVFEETGSFQACYTCPVKSLANDKFFEMKTLFGHEYVGISTGDIKVNLGAPLVIATLESYRNSLLGIESSLVTDLIIFDEYHYIQDYSRGSAWEEAIILSHRNSQLLMLSASVANPEDFVTWMNHIHLRSTVLVQTTHRPVPLKNLVFDGKKWLLEEQLPKKALSCKIPNYELASKNQLSLGLKEILRLELSPCIVYTGKRLATEKIARILASQMPSLNPVLQKTISHSFAEKLKKHHGELLIDRTFRTMVEETGIAYHHSGLPPPVRACLEALLKEGTLRICVATAGLSLGINFSVKSTMISDMKRPSDQGITFYSASDILQMTGRAGRRGKDTQGYSLWPSLSYYRAMAHTSREPIFPALKHDPSTFLGLVDKGYTLPQIEDLYSKSFHQYRSRSSSARLIHHQWLTAQLSPSVSLPCTETSSAHQYALFTGLEGKKKPRHRRSKCAPCPYRLPCHALIANHAQTPLNALHLHLHHIRALGEDDALTAYGKIAKFLPHSGGLYLAQLIAQDPYAYSLEHFTEMMACFSLGHYKSPLIDPTYNPPLPGESVAKALHFYYPQTLFSHLYEKSSRSFHAQGTKPWIYIEYHPLAGYVIQKWLLGYSWRRLSKEITTDYFAEGDLFSLIYKVANYLHSLHQADLPSLSEEAYRLRKHILRAPFDSSEIHRSSS